MLGILYNCKRTVRVNHSKSAFAKLILVFFAVLFTAVLIHPDIDLLDVHDVKITSVRSQVSPIDGSLARHAPFRLGSPHIASAQLLIFIGLTLDAASSTEQCSSSILRI
jgi:hypothetical protein